MALVLAAISAGAQSMYDGINFSENNYYGTARSISLGNAVTALGGDLGMTGINPAGSAVSRQSQITFTPGVSISATSSAYAPAAGASAGLANKETRARFVIPNGGISLRFSTGRRDGLRAVTFSALSNTTNRFLNTSSATGVNAGSSMQGAFAARADYEKMPPEIFKQMTNPWADSNYAWNILAAYGSNGIGYFSDKGRYLGSNQALDGSTPGELRQTSARDYFGSKNDIILNLGFNFEDRFYMGANLGLPIMSYSYSEYFNENAVNSTQFPVQIIKDSKTVDTYFTGFNYEYGYGASSNGVYGKFGFIWLPVEGLRLGAAIKTPTAYTVTEKWNVYERTYFENSSVNAASGPPTNGVYRYKMRSPYEINAGLAFNFGAVGLISADYEMMDYSVIRFSEMNERRSDPASYFAAVNRVCSLFAGVSHSLRLGAELNIGSNFAVRGGFGLVTSPERYYVQADGTRIYAGDYVDGETVLTGSDAKYVKANRFSYSLGFGYRSDGSFFADLGGRLTKYPVTYFYPYQEYSAAGTPELSLDRKLIDVALTVGWRF